MANNDQFFQSVRVLLEAKLPHSAMVVVSSACGEDGQAELACGLAHAFSNSGRKTALISLYGNGDTQSRFITDVDFRIFAGSSFQAPLAPVELDSLVADVRAAHEVVIVASPPIITESASLHLCRIADGVLLAVRVGRKVTADDENTVTQLQRVAATLLGVIAMRPPAERAAESSETALAPVLTRQWSMDRTTTHNIAAEHVYYADQIRQTWFKRRGKSQYASAARNIPFVAIAKVKSIAGILKATNDRAFSATLNAARTLRETLSNLRAN